MYFYLPIGFYMILKTDLIEICYVEIIALLNLT